MTKPIVEQVTEHHGTRSTSIASADHLKRWLVASGRGWMLIKSTDLVDALPWPDGVDAFIQIVECYRQHRASIPVAYAPCPARNAHAPGHLCLVCNGRGDVVAQSKSDVPEPDEMKDAVRWLLGIIREKDPTWSP